MKLLSKLQSKIVVGVVLTCCIPCAAHAQWTVTSLHPLGGDSSTATGLDGTTVVGSVVVSGGISPHASIWSGTAASWIDLNPAGAEHSNGFGAGGGVQVGYVSIGPGPFASLWTSSAASWVNLHPAGASYSYAYGTDGLQQVGQVTYGVFDHRAGLWNGSAASWVELAPSGATDSTAYDVHAGQQVGVATVGGITRASLWQGTAASWIDLHPPGALLSIARGTRDGVQVGIVVVGGITRASMWFGTAASLVDLHPTGALESRANAVYNNRQVGSVYFGGSPSAAIWTGTADSWVDLSALLPANYVESEATDVWDDGNTVFVVGYGYNALTGNYAALLWTRPVNVPPIAADDTEATDLNTAVTVAVLENDTDLDGDTLTVTNVTNPQNGTAFINPDMTVTYTPNNGFLGVDSFSYSISDGAGGTDFATVTITVSHPNRPPNAVMDVVMTDPNLPVTFAPLANDFDPDGDALTLDFVTPAGNGLVVLNPDSTVTYTPQPGFRGRDTFTYQISDGRGGTDIGRVNVLVH